MWDAYFWLVAGIFLSRYRRVYARTVLILRLETPYSRNIPQNKVYIYHTYISRHPEFRDFYSTVANNAKNPATKKTQPGGQTARPRPSN